MAIIAICDGCRAEMDLYKYLMLGGLNHKIYCEKCEEARRNPPPELPDPPPLF